MLKIVGRKVGRTDHTVALKLVSVIITAAVIMFIMPSAAVEAAAPTAAFTLWDIVNNRYATTYLNGDTSPGRVEAVASEGNTYLNIIFGDGRTKSVGIGVGETVALAKLYSADVTGDGVVELIALTRDAMRDVSAVTIVTDLLGEPLALTVPSASDDPYVFSAVFSRGYVLEITNAAYSFVQNVPVTAVDTRVEFRPDGTAPATLTASVSGFIDCTLTAYDTGQALELWQAVSSSVNNQVLGYILSTVVWNDNIPRLAAQRFTIK